MIFGALGHDIRLFRRKTADSPVPHGPNGYLIKGVRLKILKVINGVDQRFGDDRFPPVHGLNDDLVGIRWASGFFPPDLKGLWCLLDVQVSRGIRLAPLDPRTVPTHESGKTVDGPEGIKRLEGVIQLDKGYLNPRAGGKTLVGGIGQ